MAHDDERPDWPGFYRWLAWELRKEGIERTPDEVGRKFREILQKTRSWLEEMGGPPGLDDLDIFVLLGIFAGDLET